MRRLGLLLLLAAAAQGDAETAQFFVERAQRALESDDTADAEKFLRRSLEEKDAYAPALVLLAEIARARDERDAAIRHLEAAVAQAGSAHNSLAERRAIERAEELLGELAPARVEFEEMLEQHVEDLMRLAQRSRTRRPDLAVEALRSVLRLRPRHAGASALLHELEAGEEASEEKGKSLFDGKSFDGWAAAAPVWTVEDGVIKGELKDAANLMRRTKMTRGDFALVVEMRVIRDHGPNPAFGIIVGAKTDYDHFGLWIWRDSWRLTRGTGEDRQVQLALTDFDEHPERFRRSQWHTYKLVREGKELTGYVDGSRLFSSDETERSIDGYLGLWVQEQTVEIRKVLLQKP